MSQVRAFLQWCGLMVVVTMLALTVATCIIAVPVGAIRTLSEGSGN